MAAIFLGPRMGRFMDDGSVVEMPGHSTVLAALGTLILWFGWYGFNPCSTLAIKYMNIAQRVAVTTTLSAAAGGSTCLGIHVALGNPPDVSPALNGILAGLVGITGACPVVQPWVALIIGMIAAPIYMCSSHGLKRLQIDDPLDAAPVHFCCGMWGTLAVGLFADKGLTLETYGLYEEGYGIFMGGDGVQLGVQILAIVVIALWSCSTSAVMFYCLKRLGILRVSHDDELEGLDLTHHGGSAYTFDRTGTFFRHNSFEKHGAQGKSWATPVEMGVAANGETARNGSYDSGGASKVKLTPTPPVLPPAPNQVVPDAF